MQVQAAVWRQQGSSRPSTIKSTSHSGPTKPANTSTANLAGNQMVQTPKPQTPHLLRRELALVHHCRAGQAAEVNLVRAQPNL